MESAKGCFFAEESRGFFRVAPGGQLLRGSKEVPERTSGLGGRRLGDAAGGTGLLVINWECGGKGGVFRKIHQCEWQAASGSVTLAYEAVRVGSDIESARCARDKQEKPARKKGESHRLWGTLGVKTSWYNSVTPAPPPPGGARVKVWPSGRRSAGRETGSTWEVIIMLIA